MPRKQRRRSKNKTALIVLDMVSEYRFPDADRLLKSARKAAVAIARLKARANAAGIPVIYVNDTTDKWESDQQAFVQRCLQPTAKAHDVAGLLMPTAGDHFMFKPKHSAFFGTPLDTLLQQLGIGTLVLTGVTSHQCVLFTAMDAHVREYDLIVPPDCIGAPAVADTRHALYVFSHALKARLTSSRALRF